MKLSVPHAAGMLLLIAGGLASHPAAAAVDKQPSAASQQKPSDGESLALVHAINQHEIAAAKLALTRPAGEPTQALANMLLQEHTQNDAKQTKLTVKPAQTPAVAAMEHKFEAESKTLTATPPGNFERAYIDAMVKGHLAAKDLLDQRAAVARSSEVREYLIQTRQAVEDHLSQARKLQTGAVGK